MDYGMWNERTNMSMLTDFYELTMANGYLDNGCGDTIVYFDAFFRNVPENGGYAVMAGVEQVIDYLSNLHFSERDLEFLKTNYHFNDKFIDYLRNFENIQFALITHQKATMEHADVLYGVTMPEQGISRMLSLKLGDEFDPEGLE